jgi:hypothetical protein
VRHAAVNKKKWHENPFGKVMYGLNAVTDTVLDLPFVPAAVKATFKVLGPVNQGRGEGLHDYLDGRLDDVLR